MRSALLFLACGFWLAACGTKPGVNDPQANSANTVRPANQSPTPVASNGMVQNPPPDNTPAVPQREADYISFEGGLKVYPRAGRVELQVILLGSQTRPLEFLVVAPGGATHEALFATGARGEHLKRGLEMIQLREAEIKRSGRGYADVPLGDKVDIRVRFAHATTGKETIVPVEDWLWDIVRNGPPEAGGWVFTGSFEQYNPELNRSLIESDMKGNLVALWRDSSCVIDNARPNGAVPDVYSPNPRADGIPAPQSEVTLIFEARKP